MSSYMIDTNILLYRYDIKNPIKQQRVKVVLDKLIESGNGCLSVQVLSEFSQVAIRKFQLPFSNIQNHLEECLQVFRIFPVTAGVVLEAVRGVRDYRLAYFDAQIWASAKLNQVPIILSEDFNAGSTLEGVRFVNPFDSSFDLASL